MVLLCCQSRSFAEKFCQGVVYLLAPQLSCDEPMGHPDHDAGHVESLDIAKTIGKIWPRDMVLP